MVNHKKGSGLARGTCERGSAGSIGSKGGAAHFVILSREKRRMLKNSLSKIGELSRRI